MYHKVHQHSPPVRASGTGQGRLTMFGSLGPLEISLIVAVVVLLFGVGKFAGLGKDLGTSIKEFRRAVKDEDSDEKKAATAAAAAQVQAPPPPAQPVDKPNGNLF